MAYRQPVSDDWSSIIKWHNRLHLAPRQALTAYKIEIKWYGNTRAI